MSVQKHHEDGALFIASVVVLSVCTIYMKFCCVFPKKFFCMFKRKVPFSTYSNRLDPQKLII